MQYYITCKICNTKNILAEYHGESGFNAVHRLSEHEADIKNKNSKNGMAKHKIFHKENVGDPDSFEYSSVATFQKRLERQISEGVAITKSDLNHTREHILINSKNEQLSITTQQFTEHQSPYKSEMALERAEFTSFLKGICDVSSWKILGQIMELGHDITEEESGEANDDLDKATLKVSDQTESSEEAFEDLSDDDGLREVVVVCVMVCNVV